MMRRPHQPADRVFTYGMELIMDIPNCDPAVISDAEALKQYTAELVERIQMKAYGDVWIHHFGHASAVTAGYTVFQPIETSSIIVHVSEALRRVHVNVFSCQRFDTKAALDYTEAFFGLRPGAADDARYVGAGLAIGTDTVFTVLSR